MKTIFVSLSLMAGGAGPAIPQLQMIVSKANTEIEGIPIRTVVMGDAYLGKKGAEKAQHFLCLIGEKGRVLPIAGTFAPIS